MSIRHPTGPELGPDEETWTTDEMTAAFDVRGFMSPYVVVVRKSDGQLGSLQFKDGGANGPRVYFGWTPHE